MDAFEGEARGFEHFSKVDDLLSVEVLAAGSVEDLSLVAERHGVATVTPFGDRANLDQESGRVVPLDVVTRGMTEDLLGCHQVMAGEFGVCHLVPFSFRFW